MSNKYGKPGTWNYRVLRHPDEGPEEPVFAVHRVYYKENNKFGYGDVIVVGNTVEELKSVLTQMNSAVSEPVIDARKSSS